MTHHPIAATMRARHGANYYVRLNRLGLAARWAPLTAAEQAEALARFVPGPNLRTEHDAFCDAWRVARARLEARRAGMG